MVYELVDTTKAAALFGGWSETLIWSCLQKVMGKIYVTDFEKPQSALAFVGCFAFYAGVDCYHFRRVGKRTKSMIE